MVREVLAAQVTLLQRFGKGEGVSHAAIGGRYSLQREQVLQRP